MEIEVRINWTPNQWRRFFGHADMTPLVELASVMMDRMAMVVIDQRLDAINADLRPVEADIGTDEATTLAASGPGV